jgi:hypothetical protein
MEPEKSLNDKKGDSFPSSGRTKPPAKEKKEKPACENQTSEVK